jgi:hypothetical protein
MNERQITGNCLFNDTLHLELAPTENLEHRITSLLHPLKVVVDPWLTQAEKREILSSWASDIRAVPDAPALRQLDNGAVVRIDDVLQALRSLDDSKDSEQTTFDPLRPFADLRICFPTRLKSALRRGRSDDDDDGSVKNLGQHVCLPVSG